MGARGPKAQQRAEALAEHPILVSIAGPSGRKTKDQIHRWTRDEVRSAALPAARVLREYIIGNLKRLPRSRLDACIFVIEQVLGKARVKVEHEIDTTAYDSLVRLASIRVSELEAGQTPTAPDSQVIDAEVKLISEVPTGKVT